jgi:hypothetical protein
MVGIQLVGSRGKVGGVDGYLKQRVGVPRVLFGDKPASLVLGLHEEELVREQ